MKLLAGRLRDTNGALVATSFLSVKGRVARALLTLAEAFGHDVGNGRILVRQKVTQSDLAAMAGIARENVSRVLQDWMKRKVVSRLAGYYCIEDKASPAARGGCLASVASLAYKTCFARAYASSELPTTAIYYLSASYAHDGESAERISARTRNGKIEKHVQ